MEPVFFVSREEFRDWLEAHHDEADELWVGYYKKGADKTGIGYGESVEEALCFGWIDGLVHGIDGETYKRRFTPRNPDSIWSKANTERVDTMVDAGRMTPAGLALVEAAKTSGAWDAAYRLADEPEVPAELEQALTQNEAAWANFQEFSNTTKHACVTLVKDAKTDETRNRRIGGIVELAAQNLPPYDDRGNLRV